MTLFQFAIVLSGFANSAISAPTNNSGVYSPNLVGFVNDPNGRGTMSLVLSCLLTLVLCVWSALHLNVPQSGQTKLQCLWTNIRWIVTGIYAPELVVFTAWRQWSSARILHKTVKEALSMQRIGPDRHHEWDMTHSFFACTGGFAFDIPVIKSGADDRSPDQLDIPQRIPITARGMAFLAECGHLPDVSIKDIEDKSKANALAKALVICQAGWMLIQILGRLIARLPVTLLEVNTVAHVFCAFLMYAMWWNKPLLPQEPILLRPTSNRNEHDLPLSALLKYMWISSEISGNVDQTQIKSQTIIKTLFAFLHLYSKTPEIEHLCIYRSCCTQPWPVQIFQKPSMSVDNGDQGKAIDWILTGPKTTGATRLISSFHQISEDCGIQLQTTKAKDSGTAFFERRPRVTAGLQSIEMESSCAHSRLQEVTQLIADHMDIFDKQIACIHRVPKDNILRGQMSQDMRSFKRCEGPRSKNQMISVQEDVAQADRIECVHYKPQQLVASYIQNWPWDDLLRNIDGLTVGMVLWLANFLYGGIHAAAWNDHFPSVAEKWFWRASSSYIGFCGGLWVVLNYLVAAYSPLNEFWEAWMEGKKKWWHNIILGTIVFMCGMSLVVARAFIVIESFVSIRELPKGAYNTPSWAQVLPHF